MVDIRPERVPTRGDGLSASQREIVDKYLEHVGGELSEALAELNAGVQTSAAEGSFSVTLQIKKAKKGRFKATITTRVRTPREPLELEMHLDDEQQLALGFGEPEWPEGEEGGGA